MFHFARLPGWGLSWPCDASYYGYRWGLQVGPWLVLIGTKRGGDDA